MSILKISIAYTKRDFFSYKSQTIIPPIGTRVWVPFKKQTRLGIVIGHYDSSITESQLTKDAYKLKSVFEIIDIEPVITSEILTLCQWVSSYYQTPLSEILPLALPKKIRLAKEKNMRTLAKNAQISPVSSINKTMPLKLNHEQQLAVQSITAQLNNYYCFLLYGVTGSGKTEVYLQVIAKLLAENRQVLIIVPEIGLTPQLLTRFTERFAVPSLIIHSNLTDRARQLSWQLAKDEQAKLIIGTRSAVFTPLPNLGLIVIDEEHDPSLKQTERVYYCARSTALMRAYYAKIPIILGSATPTIESLHNCAQNKYSLLRLPYKALNRIPLKYHITDLRNVVLNNGLAFSTIQKIAQHLKLGNQVLVFLNRRGFAPILFCHGCGWMADCQGCDSHLTVHRSLDQVICHHCGAKQRIPTRCRNCQNKLLLPIGIGTQRLHEFLAAEFQGTKILRVDRDAITKKEALTTYLAQIKQESVQLIIGTQMLAKGHHFPHLTLIVVVDSDHSFYNHDFRALEHLGQLLTQVAGRAGRAENPGEVILQTYLPKHRSLNLLIREGYDAFINDLLVGRNLAKLPPYTYVALIRAEAKGANKIIKFLSQAKEYLLAYNVDVLGPAPAPMARKAYQDHMQLFVRSASRSKLQKALTALRDWLAINKIGNNIRWQVDVDPINL